MKQDIKIILQSLTNKNPSDSGALEKTIALLDGSQNTYILIDELKRESQRIKDFRGDREPFYFFYRSVAYWEKKDYKLAKGMLASAIEGFQIQGLSLNEALGEWLFGIIHFTNENNEQVQKACANASTILRQLIAQCEDESKYERAGEYTAHLTRIENLRDGARLSQFPKNTKKADHKLLMQAYHDELKKRYDSLRSQKAKIPPTLVASIFHTYKMLTPSHSVYSRIPVPKTVREKTIYDDLIHKIGFFEVIEQLVELEGEFKPTATREELLELVEQEWDDDIEH
jgi:hypothetical protein